MFAKSFVKCSHWGLQGCSESKVVKSLLQEPSRAIEESSVFACYFRASELFSNGVPCCTFWLGKSWSVLESEVTPCRVLFDPAVLNNHGLERQKVCFPVALPP